MAISNHQIKVLTLLNLIAASAPLPVSTLVEIPISVGVNRPEVTTEDNILRIVGELEECGQISIYEFEGKNYAVITDAGRQVGETLRSDVPVSLREKAMYLVAEEITKLRRDLCVSTEVKRSDDHYVLTVKLLDDSTEMLNLSLLCPTELQAELMARKFKNDPNGCYLNIIRGFTD